VTEELVVAGIRLDTGKLDSGADKSARSLKKLKREVLDNERAADRASKTFRRAAGAIAGFFTLRAVGRAFSRAGRAVFDTNRELQDLEATMRTVTGGIIQGERAFDLITDFAKTTPFEIQNLTKSFVDLRARGVAPNEERLKGLGNLAAAFTQDITTLTDAIVSGSAGMSRPLRRFGVDMEITGDRAVVSFQGITREIDLSADSLSEFLAEMGNSPRLANAMENRMDTLGGSLSNLADTSAIFTKEIGEQGLNAELVRTIRNMDEMIGDSDELARSLGEGAAGGVRLFNEALRVGGPILQFWADQLAKIGDQSLRLAAPRIEAFEGLEDVDRVNNLLKRAAEERNEAETAIAELEAKLAEAPPSPFEGLPASVQALRRVPGVGGLLETDESRTRASLEEQLERAQERLRKGEAEIAAGVRRRRELLTPELKPFETGLTEDSTDKIKEAETALADTRREIEAMTAALEGTKIEYDANAELASALEAALVNLLAAGVDPTSERIGKLVDELAELDNQQRDAARSAEALEAAQTFRKESRERDVERRQGFRSEISRRNFEKVLGDIERQERVVDEFGDRFADSMVTAALSTETLAGAFTSMTTSILADLSRLAIRQSIVGPLASLLGLGGGADFSGGIALSPIPGLAAGGPLRRGQPAIVGERGPELIVPDRDVTVVPNGEGRGGGGNTVNIGGPVIQGVVDRSAAETVVRRGRGEILRAIADARELGLI